MHHKPINPARRDGGERQGGREEKMGILGQREFNKRKTWRGERKDANMDDG